ncbi:GAF and ANTAR domain-containing protein [Streptomyces sp. NPDC048415]|jgi:transcriptional regulator with GAF, ATPase, and Fis domain|uniref:ANTAR domain-containing protein n=1 Tax=Streptomyces sp. NPDC048415 TaxID=3154822 RepID=UPI00341944FC
MSPSVDRAEAAESSTLHQALARSDGVDTLLRDITERAVSAVEGAVASSVTVRRDGRLLTLAGSDGLPSGLDLRQYENGDGPCVQAAREDEEQHVPVLSEETRWPSYVEYARSLGVRSVLAVPLAVDGETDAALNLYAVEEDAFRGRREIARAFAESASTAINAALRIERERAGPDDVRTALLSRSVIDQAIGILMAQERCTAQTALAVLRRASQDSNVKLRDLCGDLVARTTGSGRGQ